MQKNWSKAYGVKSLRAQSLPDVKGLLLQKGIQAFVGVQGGCSQEFAI